MTRTPEDRMGSDRELCRVCHGNGVVKIPGGLSQCDHCEGFCWEPDAALVTRLLTAARDTLVGAHGFAPHDNARIDATYTRICEALAALSARPRAEGDGP